MNTKDNDPEMRVNREEFILSTSNKPEDFGWTRESVEYLLNLAEHEPDCGELQNGKVQNDIGTFYENGICTEKDIRKAMEWYEKAVANDNDLARSNLADILRKGTDGVAQDQERAFELYKACGLPYAYYRVGECYELGRGTEKDINLAKRYYCIAYSEGHPLAVQKQKEWDFING